MSRVSSAKVEAGRPGRRLLQSSRQQMIVAWTTAVEVARSGQVWICFGDRDSRIY